MCVYRERERERERDACSNKEFFFVLQNLLMHSHENCSLGEHEVKLYDNLTSGEHEEEKMEETKGHATLSNRSTSSSKVDNIRVRKSECDWSHSKK